MINIKKLLGIRENRIGLALGGGAVLGAAHIGVLKALEEIDVKVDYITGTSAGAIVAALYAFGKRWDEMEELFGKVNWLDLSGMTISQYGLLSGKKLAAFLVKKIGQVNIEDARLPLAIIAADISTGEKVVLQAGDLATAVMASTSIPGIFIPVELDGKMLVDGGVVEKVPVSPLKEMGAQTLIAVNLLCDRGRPDNIIELLMNAFHFLVQEKTGVQIKDAHIKLEIELSDFNRVNTKQIPELIQVGYEQAKALLQDSRLARR